MRRVALVLAAHKGPLRADFRRHYHRDLLDAFRPHGGMSVGEVVDLVEDLLRLDSSTARAINRGPVWQVGDYLAADVFAAFAGKEHPARPKAQGSMKTFDPARAKARQAALARKRQREADIEAGVIT